MSRPKVVVDARMVGPTLHGIARYVTLLARGLEELNSAKPLPYEPIFLGSKGVAPFLSPFELVSMPKTLKTIGADLYHSPSFSSMLSAPCPYIVTIHDLIHLSYGSLAQKAYYELILKRFARKASAVLTVSEFSRGEIATWPGTSPGSVEVVYNALDPALGDPPPPAEVNAVLVRYGLERGKYYFCLSNPKPHKNVLLLTEAYRAFRREAGSATWPLVLNMTGLSAGEGVLGLGSLPEKELRAILAGAGALVFPSLYEGFGLPPLEAAALGVPVVASRIGAHLEALADLAPDEVLWVEPRDFDGWVAALRGASAGKVRAASSATRGKILSRFSVQRLAQHMDQIYRRVLGLKS